MSNIPRYDKYDSEDGGFRAALAANLTLTGQSYGPVAVGLDANGRVVAGKGNSGIVGILIKAMPAGALVGSATVTGVTAPGAMAGDYVDVMTDGEIVDIAGLALPAGTAIWADGTTGALAAGVAGTGAAPASGAGSTTGSVYVGHTVEATRLVVRLNQQPTHA